MNEKLHEQALEAAGRFRRAEADLVLILQEIEAKRVFFELGHTSLFDYCVTALRLSESVASNFVNVTRAARKVPALQNAIVNDELSVSKARKITPVLTVENSGLWLDKAKTLSTRKLEEEVAKVLPAEAVPERLRPVSEDRSKLSLGITREFEQKLRRVQDLESQRTGEARNIEETLNALLDLYLEAKDPVRRAERILKRTNSVISYTQGEDGAEESGESAAEEKGTSLLNELGTKKTEGSEKASAQLTAAIKHQIRLRDEGRCTHINESGQRCESRRWLDIHHLQPRSMGGDNQVTNLALLCRAHHRTEHRK